MSFPTVFIIPAILVAGFDKPGKPAGAATNGAGHVPLAAAALADA